MNRKSCLLRKVLPATVLCVALLWIATPVSQAVGWGFNDVSFAVISDSHLAVGAKDGLVMAGSSVRILEMVVTDLNRMRDLDFVLVTGDLLNNGEVWAAEKAREILDTLRVPYFVVLGNHDYTPIPPQGHSGPFPQGLSRAGFMEIFAGHGGAGRMHSAHFETVPIGCWSLDPVPGLHLVGLNTTVIGESGGHVTEPVLHWLEADLTLHRDKAALVAAHHNFVEFDPRDAGPGKIYLVDNAPAVRPAFERHRNVQAVITGHHHISGARTVEGVHYLTCPSIAAWPCEYTLFELSPDSITMRCVPVPEPGIVKEARKNLLGSKYIRPLFPEGKAGDEELLRVFKQVTELTLPMHAW